MSAREMTLRTMAEAYKRAGLYDLWGEAIRLIKLSNTQEKRHG